MTLVRERQRLADLADLLSFRGLVVTTDLLRERTGDERNAAEMWALSRAPSRSCPAWLVSLIERSKVVRLRGVCRECGCTDDEACPEGCSWTDPAHTLCSACFDQGRTT